MTKPVVQFAGEARFDTKVFPGYEVAWVNAIDHPIWGQDRVRTSDVIKKNDDGSFETLNTIYQPVKNEIQNSNPD